MPISLAKTKTKEEASPIAKLVGTTEPDSEAVAAIKESIDDLASRNEAYEAAKQLVKAYDADYKELYEACLIVYDETPADQKIEVKTDKATFTLGEVGVSREISDLKGIKSILGEGTFMKLAKINLGDIDKYLTLPQKEQVLTEVPGPRSKKLELNKADKIGLKEVLKKGKK